MSHTTTIRTTLRSYLSTPNPKFLIPQKTSKLSTTEVLGWDPIEGKIKWEDFTSSHINSIFGLLLDHEFDLPSQPSVLPAQLAICDERSFESVLLSYNYIIVNAALRAACEYLQLPQITWLVGTYARPASDRKKIYPDWAGIAEKNKELDGGDNLVPGDSKFAQQPFSFSLSEVDSSQHSDPEEDSDNAMMDDLLSREPSPIPDRWTIASEKCLEQVNHYAACYHSRYCYLVSPIEVILARRRMDDIATPSQSLAQNRSRRPPGPRAPLPSSSPESASSPSQGYTDHGHPETNMKSIELCSIEWKTEGIQEMTFNLALWAFHMMAAIESKVEIDYPDIHVDPVYQVFGNQYWLRRRRMENAEQYAVEEQLFVDAIMNKTSVGDTRL